MCKTRNVLRIVKSEDNNNINVIVKLTRKTMLNGAIRYAVVICNHNQVHTRLKSYDNISEAWTLYKKMMAV